MCSPFYQFLNQWSKQASQGHHRGWPWDSSNNSEIVNINGKWKITSVAINQIKLFNIIISFRVGKGPRTPNVPPNAYSASPTFLAVLYGLQHHCKNHNNSNLYLSNQESIRPHNLNAWPSELEGSGTKYKFSSLNSNHNYMRKYATH